MMCSDPSRLLQCLCYHVCVCTCACVCVRVLLEKIPEEFLIFFAAKYMMTIAVLFFKDLRVCGGRACGGQQEAISLDLVFDSLNTTVCVCVCVVTTAKRVKINWKAGENSVYFLGRLVTARGIQVRI